MACSDITSLIGMTCYPLSDDGSVAMLETSFTFADGDAIPVFIEKTGGMVRFFDDGGTLMHFAGRGLRLIDNRNTKFLTNAGAPHGVSLSDSGDFEVWAAASDAPKAFASYVSAMVAIVDWERSQEGVATDLSLLIDEVGQCLRALNNGKLVTEKPEFVGVSGQNYILDFDFEGKAVIAITPHRHSVGAAIRKLVDIRSSPENAGFEAMIVLDDRHDPVAAKTEGRVLNAVGNVWPMTRLEARAGLARV